MNSQFLDGILWQSISHWGLFQVPLPDRRIELIPTVSRYQAYRPLYEPMVMEEA